MLNLTFGSDVFHVLLAFALQEAVDTDSPVTRSALRIRLSKIGITGKRFTEALDSVTDSNILLHKKQVAGGIDPFSLTDTYTTGNPVLGSDYALGDSEDMVSKVYAVMQNAPEQGIGVADIQDQVREDDKDYMVPCILRSLYVLSALSLVARRGSELTGPGADWVALTHTVGETA